LGGDANIATDQHPTVQRAQAALDKAELDLSYAVVKAPENGIVTKVEQVQPGSYVTASTPVFSMMSDRIWVEANFKETELTHMRQGQDATVEIDTYPDAQCRGKVLSLSPGTGLTFSLLPPENATGNWVKVVQRVPVKIVFEKPPPPDKPLRLGLSVEVGIDISDKSGPLLTSMVQRRFQKDGETMPNETLKMVPMPERQTEQKPGAKPSAGAQRQLFLNRSPQ